MSVKLETYYNIKEKKGSLAGLYKKYGGKAAFIVPGTLDKDLLVELASEDGSYFGARPCAWTWSDLYSEAARAGGVGHRRVIDPPDHNLIINYTLKKFLAGRGGGSEPLPPGVTRRGFASVLGDNIRELLLEEISPQRIRELLSIEDDVSAEAILCGLYYDYLRYLEENRIADSAQIPELVRQGLNTPAGQKFAAEHVFVFVGFLSFTGGQMKLIEAMRELAECVFVLPETGLDTFYDAILQLGVEYGERPAWSTKICRLVANNEHLQYEALARELALWRSGEGELRVLGELTDYGEIGIQVAPQQLRTLQNSLSRYRIPHNAQVREFAAHTQIGELLHEIWDAWLSGWEAKKTASLMSGSLMSGSASNFARYMEKFPEGRDSWLSVLKGKQRDLFGRVEKLCLNLSEGGTPPEVMTLWRDFVSGLLPAAALAEIADDEISLDGVIRDASAVVSELDTKIAVLEDLRQGIGPAGGIHLSGSEAVAYISDWGRTAKLPIPLPQSMSTTIYAGSPPVLSSHKYWIMTGVDYNSWPGTLRESPLLRDSGKKALNGSAEPTDQFHIPEVHELREQKEALFRRLIAAADAGVIITRSMTDSKGRPTGDSQFVEALFDSKKTSSARKYDDLGKIEYPISRMLPRDADIWFPQAELPQEAEKVERGKFPRAVTKSEEEKVRVPLNSLDDWSKCQFLYWCRRTARFESRRRELFNPMRAGLLMHKLWETAWKEYIERNISLPQFVITHWQETVGREYPELLTDQRLRRREQLLYRQASLLAKTQEEIEERVNGRTRVELEYILPEYEIDGVVFSGRADRVDFFERGAVVLDYKTGNADQYRGDLQLAAYSAVLREKGGFVPYGYGWFGLRDAKLYGFFDGGSAQIYKGRSANAKSESCADKAENALGVMHEMAVSLRTGIFKANYDSKYCRACEFSAICRRKEYPLYQLEEETAAEGESGA